MMWSHKVRNAGESDIEFEEQQAIRKEWETVLGRSLTTEEVFPRRSLTAPDIHIAALDRTPSNGPRLVKTLVDQTRDIYRWETPNLEGPADTSLFILECNNRSVFNSLFGYLIEVPYMPSAARTPFHRVFYERARTVQHHLSALEKIESEHRRTVESHFPTSQNNLILPFSLGVVLSKIDSLSEFFERSAEVREQAEPLRRHRADLDEALISGDRYTAEQLRSAFEQEANSLCEKFPYAPLAAGVSTVLAAVGSATPSLILATIVVFTISSVVPTQVLRRLEQKAFRPQHWALSNMVDTTRAIENLLPKLVRLWAEPKSPRTRRIFVDRFDRVKQLRYA